MSVLLENLKRELTPVRDPRTASWVVHGNAALITALFTVYVFIVKVAGPRFMKHRKPYDGIKPLVLMYNACNVVLNLYFMVAFLSKTYVGGGYNVICQGVDFEARDEKTMSMLNLCWWYLLVRISDFMDTVFFVLRKKDNNVSFLHIAHHMLIVFNGFFGLTYGPDGQIVMGMILNCFVHVVMYTYYFLSLLGPAVQKYLWWKRYLTQFQLVQFTLVFTHMLVPMFVNCGYPRVHISIILCEVVFFFIMFTRFYLQAYRDRKAPSNQCVDSDDVKGKVE